MGNQSKNAWPRGKRDKYPFAGLRRRLGKLYRKAAKNAQGSKDRSRVNKAYERLRAVELAAGMR